MSANKTVVPEYCTFEALCLCQYCCNVVNKDSVEEMSALKDHSQDLWNAPPHQHKLEERGIGITIQLVSWKICCKSIVLQTTCSLGDMLQWCVVHLIPIKCRCMWCMLVRHGQKLRVTCPWIVGWYLITFIDCSSLFHCYLLFGLSSVGQILVRNAGWWTQKISL